MADFTSEQIRILQDNNAVQAVTRTRINYRKWFQIWTIRQDRCGVRPVVIFTDAGLPPKLIGYKRIERCMSRWRRKYKDADLDAIDMEIPDIERLGRAIAEIRGNIEELKGVMARMREDVDAMERSLCRTGADTERPRP